MKDIPPANFGNFYDNLEKPKSGGTGHTMIVCDELKFLMSIRKSG